jgi:putative ABC transport system permease protein
VGVIGIVVSVPAVYGLARIAEMAGAKVIIGPELLAAVAGITLVMALGSGLAALRSLRLIEPEQLLR